MPLKDKRLSQFRLYQLPDLCLRCLQFVHKFWKYVTKTKCQNCVKQRNPAETKDSGCQKTHKIHTCPDRYLIGRKKTVDPIDGNLSQYCPNAEIHDHLSFMFHKNHKKHCHTGSCDCQKPHSFIHSVTLLPLHLYESDGKLFLHFRIYFPFEDYTGNNSSTLQEG